MKRFPLAVILVAVAAGRARADLHCVSTLSQAGPHGELCGGSSGPHPQGQAQTVNVNPQATTQLVNMAAGIGGAAAAALVTTPLSNPYQGRQPVKPVVTDDDGIKTPGTGAASDIISSYKPRQDDDSYADRLAHFRELHDAEMDQRRAALEKLKGTDAEKWCAAHIGILFPNPPVTDVLNRYANTVRAYDREKQIWDKRCGGPSAQAGYQGFDDELAALKPDAAPAPSAGTTTKAPTYEAPEQPPTAAPAPEKPGDSFADAEKDLEGPAPKKAAPPADATPPAQNAPADVGAAPDSAPSPDDSKNTNKSTNFFGQSNAKITEKDLADTRAPDLKDSRPGAPGVAGGGGKQWAGIPKAPGMPEGPAPEKELHSWGTPEQVAVMMAPKRPPQFPNPMDYLIRSIPFLKDKAQDKAGEELKGETKKAIIANFGGFEGRILANLYDLPEYVLGNVMRAAKGDLPLKQADWLTIGGANVIFNLGSIPNAVLAKIASKGDVKEGMTSYALETATDKTTDAVNDAVVHNAADGVAKGYDFLRYGAVSEKAPDGMETNMYANRMANTRVLVHEGKTALKGGTAVYNMFQDGQGDAEKPSGDQ